MSKEELLDEEIRQLVIERLKAIPSGKKISIGSEGDFTVEELIKRVKENDEIGRKIIQVEMTFLQSWKTGALLND